MLSQTAMRQTAKTENPPKNAKEAKTRTGNVPKSKAQKNYVPVIPKGSHVLLERSTSLHWGGIDLSCKFLHSLKEYLETKMEDIGDKCPVFEALGKCRDGWGCRWLGGHIRKAEDGEKGGLDGWVLVVDEEKFRKTVSEELNRVDLEEQKSLRQEKFPLPLSTEYLKRIEEEDKANGNGGSKDVPMAEVTNGVTQNGTQKEDTDASLKKEASAIFNETPLRPTEKRKVHSSFRDLTFRSIGLAFKSSRPLQPSATHLSAV